MSDQLAPKIELVGITKSFGSVHANQDINLAIGRGTIHGIVGENGAGKSTLMSIVYGFYRADAGQIRIDGKEVQISDSRAAIAHGIGMVHQHFKLVDNLSVLENVMLGAEKGRLLRATRQNAREELKRIAREYELFVDPDAIVENLSVGAQQRVEILKALFRGADVLILDEPTGVLTPAEADHLFRILNRLRDECRTIILITHKLREIVAITDFVSVMRGGKLVNTWPTKEIRVDQIAEAMVGRRVLLRVEKPPAEVGGTVLEVSGLRVRDARGVVMVKDVSFSVRAGEIVGIAGVAGNGQSELLQAIAGTRKAESGVVKLNGKAMDPVPSELRSAGLAHIPEDRQSVGLILSHTLMENASLGYHYRPKFGAGPLLDGDALLANALDHIGSYDIRPPNPQLPARSFSGGNQQKIVVAREFENEPVAILVGQPTRGVDIGAIELIHRRLLDLRTKNIAILLVSVELDEIRALSDRILVMFDGQIMGELSPEASEGEIGLLMAGVAGEGSEAANV